MEESPFTPAEVEETEASDESLAATQEAFENERDKIAAAVSELDASPLEDVLGYDLIWNHDTGFMEAQVAMVGMFESLIGNYERTRVFIDNGVPADAMGSDLRLNMVSGPLVMASLQLLGLYIPELREDILAILRAITVPEATEEEAALFEDVSQRLNAEHEALIERAVAEMQAAAAEAQAKMQAADGLPLN